MDRSNSGGTRLHYLDILDPAHHHLRRVLGGGDLGALVPAFRQRDIICPVLYTGDETAASLGEARVKMSIQTDDSCGNHVVTYPVTNEMSSMQPRTMNCFR